MIVDKYCFEIFAKVGIICVVFHFKGTEVVPSKDVTHQIQCLTCRTWNINWALFAEISWEYLCWKDIQI